MIDQLAVLHELVQTIKDSPVPKDALQRSVDVVQRLTGWPGVAVLEVGGEPLDHLHTLATSGLLIPACSSSAAPLRRIQEQSTPLLLTASEIAQSFPDASGLTGVLLAPIKLGARVYAVLCLANDQVPGFDPSMLPFAAALADTMALALQRERLCTTLEQEVLERKVAESRLWSTIHKTETLYRVGRSLIAPDSSNQVIQRVLNTVTAALRAQQTWLCTLDVEGQRILDCVTSGREPTSIPDFTACYVGAIRKTTTEGWPLILSSDECATQLPLEALGWPCETPPTSAALIPLSFRSPIRGILIALNRADQPEFSQQDLDLLMAVAGQIVQAMESAQLFETVREERGRLRALVESSRDAIFLVDRQMRFTVINRPALHYLGLPGEPQDWVNRSAWDVLRRVRDEAPGVVSTAVEQMRRWRAGVEEAAEGECRIGNRTLHWLHLPVEGLERSPSRLLMLRDITEARLIEQLREDLTHTMVHDLRNPLTGISAALKLLLRNTQGVLHANQREILNIAIGSTERLLALVNAILEISRLESGQMPLNRSVFAFAEAAEAVLALGKPIVEQKGLQVSVELNASLPPVRADRELVERVLENLMGNACKFAAPGGSVMLSASIPAGAADKLQVTIRDSGSGIPEEIRDRLFQKFVAGPQLGRGSGLGLAFCRMALEAHGERIWVEETSEQGSAIAFTLPIAADTQPST